MPCSTNIVTIKAYATKYADMQDYPRAACLHFIHFAIAHYVCVTLRTAHMAGSLKYFAYTTNGGSIYPLKMDESNGEAVGNTDYTDTTVTAGNSLPRNITPRYALYRSSDGLHTRKIPVTANNVDLEDLPASFEIPSPVLGGANITVFRQSLIGEVQRAAVPADTGQTDGDAT